MRLPSRQDMENLNRLSSVREQAAMLELSEVAARRQTALDRVNQLRGELPLVKEIDYGLVLQRWLVWRDQEIKRRLGALAVVSAEYAETAQRCGRIIAENAVVEKVSKLAQDDARETREKRHAYDHTSASHFLANNIRDQNI